MVAREDRRSSVACADRQRCEVGLKENEVPAAPG